MIKTLIICAALLGSTAALAQNSMDNGSMSNMGNGSMSGTMDNGTMSSDGMANGSAMSNGSMSNGAMSNGSMSGDKMAARNDKCMKKHPSYDAATGMYTTKMGKQKKCMM